MLLDELLALQDPKYREFTILLNPTLDPESIIGVRVPELRKLAQTLKKSPDKDAFLKDLPHRYHEENMLHAFYLSHLRDVDALFQELDRFAPYITGWAVCDSIYPKVLHRYPEQTLLKIRQWLQSNLEFTLRLAVSFLRLFFLDENFTPEVLELAASVDTDRYYLKMIVAWFFCDAVIKKPEAALPFITERRLVEPTHLATIQKCVESRRITPELKEKLKTYRV